MRIGLDLLYLIPGTVGGTETYAAGLLKGLAEIARDDEFLVFVNKEAWDWPLPEQKNFRRIVCGLNAGNRAVRYAYQQLIFPRLLDASRVDMVHSLGYVAPAFTRCPMIVTVPDCNFHALRDQMSWSKRSTLAFFIEKSVRHATRVVTISEYSGMQIQELLGVPADRVVVTHLAGRYSGNGSDNQREPASTGRWAFADRPYVVAFGSPSPHKNIDRLVDAFLQAKSLAGLPHRLVLVGNLPLGFLATLQQKGQTGDVVCTGWLTDDELTQVLSGAEMLAFPSLYEGFGLPTLDAMALGVPVISTNRASLPEVCGDAALMIDPLSVEDIAAKIALLATHPGLRADLARKGIDNALRFSWNKTAALTLNLYQQVFAGISRSG